MLRGSGISDSDREVNVVMIVVDRCGSSRPWFTQRYVYNTQVPTVKTKSVIYGSIVFLSTECVANLCASSSIY